MEIGAILLTLTPHAPPEDCAHPKSSKSTFASPPWELKFPIVMSGHEPKK